MPGPPTVANVNVYSAPTRVHLLAKDTYTRIFKEYTNKNNEAVPTGRGGLRM